MIVKKKNPEWFPSEKKDLKVGETIEITDPRTLILSGDVIALDEKGAELSAYELYGVIVKDELKEFREYIESKKANSLKASLEKEKEELEKQLAEARAAKETPVVEEKKVEPKKADGWEEVKEDKKK